MHIHSQYERGNACEVTYETTPKVSISGFLAKQTLEEKSQSVDTITGVVKPQLIWRDHSWYMIITKKKCQKQCTCGLKSIKEFTSGIR